MTNLAITSRREGLLVFPRPLRLPVVATVITAIFLGAPLHGQWQGTSPVYLPSGTRAGIGTTGPNAALDVRVASQSLDGIWEMAADNHFLRVSPSLGAINYNPIVQAGDTAIIYSNGAAQDTGALVLAPWGSVTSGVRITGTGNVGIGTTNPQVPLQVHVGTNQNITLSSDGSSRISALNDSISANVPLHFQAADYHFFNGSAVSEVMTIGSNGYVGINETAPQYLLSVKGQIGAQEVIVTNTGWADYVFAPGYQLTPLAEVASYIQTNHHLPDIPSESEVKEKGISIGDMQAKLLAKIEELTLRLIQDDEKNRQLQDRIAKLENERPNAARKEAERP